MPHLSALDSNTTQSHTELVAVLLAVTGFSARVLTIQQGTLLPFGPLTPIHHSLQAGARAWVQQQTQQPLGYMEQLYTFVDIKRSQHIGVPLIYVSYLGLVREIEHPNLDLDVKWCDWYDFFPWENIKCPTVNAKIHLIVLKIQDWVDAAPSLAVRQTRLERMNLCWGKNGYEWLEENTLLRYELMYEAGLIAESPYFASQLPEYITGKPMQNHHRRVLATAISRLRAKLKYRPVIFDLMPPEFTLLQLQKTIEALTGTELHKQNFRRLMHHQNIIEATGKEAAVERGRPAQLYRFKQDVLQEHLLSGYKLPLLNN